MAFRDTLTVNSEGDNVKPVIVRSLSDLLPVVESFRPRNVGAALREIIAIGTRSQDEALKMPQSEIPQLIDQHTPQTLAAAVRLMQVRAPSVRVIVEQPMDSAQVQPVNKTESDSEVESQVSAASGELRLNSRSVKQSEKVIEVHNLREFQEILASHQPRNRAAVLTEILAMGSMPMAEAFKMRSGSLAVWIGKNHTAASWSEAYKLAGLRLSDYTIKQVQPRPPSNMQRSPVLWPRPTAPAGIAAPGGHQRFPAPMQFAASTESLRRSLERTQIFDEWHQDLARQVSDTTRRAAEEQEQGEDSISSPRFWEPTRFARWQEGSIKFESCSDFDFIPPAQSTPAAGMQQVPAAQGGPPFLSRPAQIQYPGNDQAAVNELLHGGCTALANPAPLQTQPVVINTQPIHQLPPSSGPPAHSCGPARHERADHHRPGEAPSRRRREVTSTRRHQDSSLDSPPDSSPSPDRRRGHRRQQQHSRRQRIQSESESTQSAYYSVQSRHANSPHARRRRLGVSETSESSLSQYYSVTSISQSTQSKPRMNHQMLSVFLKGIKTYGGGQKENLLAYIASVERVAKAERLSKHDKLRLAIYSLTDSAAEVIGHDITSWTKIKKTLKEHFGQSEQEVEIGFKNIQQKKDESVAEFARRLRAAGERVLSRKVSNGRDSALVRQLWEDQAVQVFRNGLHPHIQAQVGKAVDFMPSKPSLSSVINIASNVEVAARASAGKGAVHAVQSQVSTPAAAPPAPPRAAPSAAPPVQHQHHQYQQQPHWQQGQQHGKAPQQKSGSGFPGQNVVCYKCNTAGHIARNCFSVAARQSQGGPSCQICSTHGHQARRCPIRFVPPPNRNNNNGVQISNMAGGDGSQAYQQQQGSSRQGQGQGAPFTPSQPAAQPQVSSAAQQQSSGAPN